MTTNAESAYSCCVVINVQFPKKALPGHLLSSKVSLEWSPERQGCNVQWNALRGLRTLRTLRTLTPRHPWEALRPMYLSCNVGCCMLWQCDCLPHRCKAQSVNMACALCKPGQHPILAQSATCGAKRLQGWLGIHDEINCNWPIRSHKHMMDHGGHSVKIAKMKRPTLRLRSLRCQLASRLQSPAQPSQCVSHWTNTWHPAAPRLNSVD